MPRLVFDHTGLRYGRLVVLERCYDHPYNHAIRWVCKCDCGKMVTRTSSALKHGHSTSCGCWSREKKTTHDLSHSPTYRTWRSMLARCYDPKNPSYRFYGGRGITVCDGWKSFQYFVDDMGIRPDKHTLDRINVHGNYNPENCRWATAKQQARNRTDTKLVTHNGQSRTLVEWSEIYGIKTVTLIKRLRSGMSFEDAVARPVAKRKTFRKGLTFGGETKTLTAWAEQYGISLYVLSDRLSRGWDPERALTQPLRVVKRRAAQ